MELRVSNLKTDFNTISLIRSKIISIFESLKNKSDKLKNLYADFIKQSNSQLFIFGLDSFHFQSKLIDLEYDDMKRIFLFVNNRMYCEYFKLYKLICSYVIENITDKKIIEIIKGNNFPVYKDLEPFKEYKFEITMEIHENILVLLNSIISIINNRENELSIHRSKQLIGLNIDNFVNSFNYEIILMKEKINLFLSYIEFFHKLHNKYLKRFNNKIQLMINYINSDVQFDENAENNVNNEAVSNTKDDDNDDSLIDSHDILINNHETVLENIYIDTKDNETKNEILIDNSALTTPTNSSLKSIESQNTNKSKFAIPKLIKNGFKKVTNIFTGCNNPINEKLIVEELNRNNRNETIKEKMVVNLNDFSDNITDSVLQEVNYNEDIIIEEPSIEESVVEDVKEEEIKPVEEPSIVVVEDVKEEEIKPVEEPSIVVVEDVKGEEIKPVEEPVIEEPVVEEPVVEEEIKPVEEPVIEELVVEEVIQPVEEPIIEEPPIVAVEEVIQSVEQVTIEEPPIVAVEEVIQPVEEPIIEEPPIVAVEEVIQPVEEVSIEVSIEEPSIVAVEEENKPVEE